MQEWSIRYMWRSVDHHWNTNRSGRCNHQMSSLCRRHQYLMFIVCCFRFLFLFLFCWSAFCRVHWRIKLINTYINSVFLVVRQVRLLMWTMTSTGIFFSISPLSCLYIICKERISDIASRRRSAVTGEYCVGLRSYNSQDWCRTSVWQDNHTRSSAIR